VLQEDPFGLSTRFVGLANFIDIFTNTSYRQSIRVTAVFSFSVAAIAMSVSLLLAVMADRAVRAATAYKTLIIWPYAVAPVVSAVLWYFLFNPTVGMISFFLNSLGYLWNHSLNGTQAMILVIIAAAWREISYNFLFFLAGLQAIPKSFIEAAAIDGATPARRFWTIAFPLLSPTAFFLLVMNIVYAFFDTFGVIHAITEGGPNYATNIMVYKVYRDGFINLDLGGSAAQSVILMAVVIALTVIQFRYIERKVHY
jgi:sn-glycerol 3-phosphate transport system permease protein